MNLFRWNYRGLGLSRTVQELVALVRAKSPMLVFLSETRMKGSRVANLRWRLGLKHCSTVDSVGTGGGLALFWHESVDVSLIEKHQRYIDVHVKDNPSAVRMRITFVYGEPRTDQRHVTWQITGAMAGYW